MYFQESAHHSQARFPICDEIFQSLNNLFGKFIQNWDKLDIIITPQSVSRIRLAIETIVSNTLISFIKL